MEALEWITAAEMFSKTLVAHVKSGYVGLIFLLHSPSQLEQGSTDDSLWPETRSLTSSAVPECQDLSHLGNGEGRLRCPPSLLCLCVTEKPKVALPLASP